MQTDEAGESGALKYIHHHRQNRQLVGSRCLTRGPSPAFCDDLEGWDGGSGREGLQKVEVCIYIADS